ncbi:uncharacterized protein LOC114915208 [Cajanus cajan]|uniref:uncharacterized protein LOC114915208 n=1 Tax=Cajanus cajan TaxID=3821 RepID=UPI0010FAE6FD|nr:uncharacterized protein LOC114915208 [Cajanus cajan]
MDNNNFGFVSYDDEDPFLCPLIPNLLVEVDPSLVLPKAQPHQQNDHPFGLQHGNNVPFTIQDQFMQDNNNNGEVANFDVESRGQQTMHVDGSNNISNEGGVGNFEIEGRGQTMHGDGSNNIFNEGRVGNFEVEGYNNIFNEGGVGNIEVRDTSTMRHQPMHHHFSNGGVGNLEMRGGFPSRQRNQTQPPNENMAPPFHQGVTSVSYWPLIPRPFFCTCCQVLRQIIHTNGVQFEKLEIHGTIGVMGHAIIQNRNITQGDHPSSDPHQIIDFHYRSTEQIKSFMVEYCTQMSKLGYIIVEDVLSTYYEILCTGVDWAKDTSDEDIDLIPSNDMGQDFEPEPQPQHEPEPEAVNLKRKRRRPDAEQRKRIKAMKLEDCSDYFHLTIGAAAQKLDVCISALKSLCRRNNLENWPHRKLTSNMKKVAVLRRALDSPDSRTRTIAREQIKILQDEVLELCVGITPTGIEMVQL